MVKIIALDEVGKFEERFSGIRFVGGYTFYLNNYEEYEEENEKIELFLTKVCEEFNSQYLSQYPGVKVYYPYSLHGGSTNSPFYNQQPTGNKIQDEKKMVYLYDLAKRFKAILKDEVVRYISGKNAQFYAYLDPYITTEGDERETIGSSNLLDDTRGANMYERMATMALFNQAFYATDGQDHDFAFELATRTLPNIADSFKEMYATKNGKSTITHTSTYKTAVSALLYSETVERAYLNTNYRFNVKSINYSPDHPVRKNYPTTPYLYLADIVCGYILDKIRESFSINESTSVNKIDPCLLYEFCSKTGIQVQIYNKTDTLFRKMVQYAKAGSLEKYQHAKYCILNCGLLYQDFYKSFWIPKLEDYIHRMLRNSDYRRKVKSMIPEFVVYADGFMGPREINYEAGLFVATELSTIVNQMDDYRDRKIMLFRLYDIILRGHNHRGAIVETQKYISKCEEYKAAVGIEEYISHTLRTLVYYFNALKFEDALSACLVLEEPVVQLKKVYTSAYNKSSKISSSITEDRNAVQNHRFPLAGKLYSSIGQAYGFLGQYAKAKKYFKKALSEFENNSADYSITLSHFMQLLISNKKKADYEVYSHIYFGASDLWSQLTSAFSADDGGFALLIFVKAFRVFYANDVGNANILVELIRRTSEYKDHREHPWELIYKNLYEAILKQPKKFKKQDFEYLKDAAMTCIQEADATIKMIQISIRLQFDENTGRTLAGEYLSPGEVLTCNEFIKNIEKKPLVELREWFASKLTYEYM